MSARDITNSETMLELQGDRVLLYAVSGEDAPVLTHIMTIVRVMDVGRQFLRLAQRERRPHKPDWTFSQAYCDALRSAEANPHGAKWEITVRSK